MIVPEGLPKGLRVLQVCTVPTWGGGEAHVLALSQALRARGVAVEVLCRRKGALWPRLRAAGVPARPGVGGLWALPRLCRAVRAGAEPVVHAHAGRDYWPALLAVRLAGRGRLVLTRHLRAPLPTHRLPGLWRSTVGRYVAVSEAIAEDLAGASGIPRDRLAVVPNGLEASQFERRARQPGAREALGLSGGAWVVACVGRLSPEKGQEDLVRALPALALRVPEAALVLVGDDAAPGKPYRARLAALADELGVVGRVAFAGHRDDVAELLAEADVAVLPSRSDAFPLILLEAMAQGCPVVATDAVSVMGREIGRDAALTVPAGDPTRLAAALAEVRGAPEAAARRAEAARKLVVERFAWDASVAALVAVYRAVLGEARR